MVTTHLKISPASASSFPKPSLNKLAVQAFGAGSRCEVWGLKSWGFMGLGFFGLGLRRVGMAFSYEVTDDCEYVLPASLRCL